MNNFRAVKVSETVVKLQWDKPAAEVEIEQAKEFSLMYKYRISIKSDNIIANYEDVLVDSDEVEQVIYGLAPASTFTLSIAATKDGLTGPSARLRVTTQGKR